MNANRKLKKKKKWRQFAECHAHRPDNVINIWIVCKVECFATTACGPKYYIFMTCNDKQTVCNSHFTFFYLLESDDGTDRRRSMTVEENIFVFIRRSFLFFYINFRPGFSHPRFSNATHFTYLNSIRSYYFYLFYIYRMCRCRYVSSVYLNFHFSSLTFRIVKIHIIPYSRLVPGCTTSSYPPNKPS